MVTSGPVHRPIITKAYKCVFMSFIMKAVHLEAVSKLTTAAFIVFLHRFIARYGKPTTIWSNHSKKFMGAAREFKDLYTYLGNA